MRYRYPLDGYELLRVDRLVAGNKLGFEVGYFVEILESYDGERGGAEFMFHYEARTTANVRPVRSKF